MHSLKKALKLSLLLFVLGCGDDVGAEGDLVGGECDSDRDCEEVCLKDKSDFPGGMCSVECKSDQDCPIDTVCVDKKGGICAYQCDENDDCRRGYRCDGTKRKSGGEDFVCIGD